MAEHVTKHLHLNSNIFLLLNTNDFKTQLIARNVMKVNRRTGRTSGDQQWFENTVCILQNLIIALSL